MWIEEEVNDVSISDKNATPRRPQTFNHCYKCGKTGHFQKDCPGDGDEENVEPQRKIIGTVTHTMEAQTPVTDKSLSDFMYKNFKQTEKLKKKYTATKTKLKKTKQELEDIKNRKPEAIFTCTVSLSVFAGPERILRRFYVFAEEPRKSTITTSEPCSPVFKEAQPRPSTHRTKAVNQFN